MYHNYGISRVIRVTLLEFYSFLEQISLPNLLD